MVVLQNLKEAMKSFPVVKEVLILNQLGVVYQLNYHDLYIGFITIRGFGYPSRIWGDYCIVFYLYIVYLAGYEYLDLLLFFPHTNLCEYPVVFC